LPPFFLSFVHRNRPGKHDKAAGISGRHHHSCKHAVRPVLLLLCSHLKAVILPLE
jgi:hypothetical protein